MLQMRKRVELEEQKRSQELLDSLNDQIQRLTSSNHDQTQRITRLLDEQHELEDEFKRYREEKRIQESTRETYLKEVEDKYEHLSVNHEETKRRLTDQLEFLTAQNHIKHDESTVLFLRLKYLR